MRQIVQIRDSIREIAKVFGNGKLTDTSSGEYSATNMEDTSAHVVLLGSGATLTNVEVSYLHDHGITVKDVTKADYFVCDREVALQKELRAIREERNKEKEGSKQSGTKG